MQKKMNREKLIASAKKIINLETATTLFLFMMFVISCNNGTNKNTNKNHPGNSDIEQEWLKKLDGEWAVQNNWSDSILTFSNTRNKNFKQEIFPSYNTITFNLKNKTMAVKTYGEFGCGMAAIQNLEINHSKWNLKNGLLSLKFDYSDYSGQHQLESVYSIERTARHLILKRTE